jgi:two-component system response regulator CpxR
MRPKKCMLLVEPNQEKRSLRKFLFQTRGYRVLAAEDANTAIDILKALMPGNVDILLTELQLPQMDGNELVRRAKELHPDLPTIIVSWRMGSSTRLMNCEAFLPKGFHSPMDLIERVRVLVQRKRGPKKKVQVAA